METSEEIRAHIERIVRDGVDEFDTKLRTKDGRVKEVLADVQAIDFSGRVVFHSVLRDITERKHAEEAMRESEERFRGAFEHTAAGMALVSMDGRFTRVNDALCRMLGYTTEELRARRVKDVTHPDDTEESMARLDNLVCGLHKVFTMEKRYLHQDGTVLWGLTTVSLVRNADDEPLYFIAETVDITERKHTEQALRRSEEHLRHALRAARVGTWEWNIQTNEVFWSDSVEEIFGLPEGSFEGSYQAYLDLIYPEDRAEVEDKIGRALDHDEPYTVEHRIVWPDGAVRWLAGDGRAFKEGGRAVRMAGTVVDITDRKQAEANALRLQNELAHVARVSTMGEMAAGLAHELNQPLTVISGYARNSVHRIETGDAKIRDLAEPLETIAREAERAGEIIRRLWNLISKGEPRRVPVSINDLIREVADLMDHDARQRGAVLRLELADRLRPIMVDAIQIQQVVMNLVCNAFEAMGGLVGERPVVIRTSASEPDAVCVAVHDVGTGVAESALPRIFEPFFSTKPNGLGMGLTISRTIVDAHGGHLPARSEEGGTTVEFTLPTEKE